MPAAPSKAVRSTPFETPCFSIGELLLFRVVTGGASRSDLQRDLAQIFAPSVSGTAFRRGAEQAIQNFTSLGLITEARGRLTATSAGVRSAEEILGTAQVAKATWEAISKGALVLFALGLQTTGAAVRAVERPDGLVAVVLQRHFGVALSRVLSFNDLRAELAIVALERAFGNKIKTGLGKGSGLAASTSRLLAGQLFRKPREFTSDGKLVRALAAEVAGAANETSEALQLAILRRLTNPGDVNQPPAISIEKPALAPLAKKAPKAANDSLPLSALWPPKISPPDLSEFAGAVLDAARPISQGWPGNRKAFISRVWQAIRIARREWDLTEIAFKTMLAEAHRSGQLVLATADLKDKSSLKDFEESKILYKNTVWHFVRVED